MHETKRLKYLLLSFGRISSGPQISSMISVSLEHTHHTFSLSFLLEGIAVNVEKANVSQLTRPEGHFLWLFQGHSVYSRLLNKVIQGNNFPGYFKDITWEVASQTREQT